MEDYPRSLTKFEERFGTEEACWKYLAQMRWPDGFICPACNSQQGWQTKRGLWLCQQCGRQTSVTAGTIFHGTHKPLTLWFRAMWHITSQKYGANALGLQRVLGLGSYQTAWEWLHRLRRAMVRPNRDQLSGLVQVDETYVGGKKPGKTGRGAEGKVLVAIAVEDKAPNGLGRIRLATIKDASADSLSGFVREMVAPGSVIKTDDWLGYSTLSGQGFRRQILPPKELKLPHLVAALLKRWLLGTYQGAVRPSQLAYYLDEFTFRFNRRTSHFRGKLFYRLVQQALQVDPIFRKNLKADGLSLNYDNFDDLAFDQTLHFGATGVK